MNPFETITLAIIFPFILAFAIPAIAKRAKNLVGWVATAIAAISFGLIFSVSKIIIDGGVIEGSVSWVPSAGISFSIYADGLSMLIGFLASGIGVIIMSYSNGYMSHEEDLGRYYKYLLLFMASMLGMIFSANMIQLFIFWELTSITSFMLIGFWYHNPPSIYGATKSLLLTGVGGLIMLAGFIMLKSITGSYDISSILHDETIISSIKSHELFLPILITIFIGAAAKSAQGPFYIWLPNAMEAPTPVSAFLHSATMVKAGIYLIARIHPIFSGTISWFVIVSGVGMATMLVAGFLAFKQTDTKAILAYSTISQLGYLTTMYGYTTMHHPDIGVVAATFHLLNHAVFKACLFLVIGIVAHEAATRDIRKLGGLRREMPITFIITCIGALSMAGIPPLNGFISKEMFYESSLEMGAALGGVFTVLIPAIAVLGGVFTFAYSIKLIDGIFLGKRGDLEPAHIHDPPLTMLVPAGFLAVLAVVFGVLPWIPAKYIVEPAASGIMLEHVSLHPALWHGFTTPLYMTIATIALGLLIYTKYDAIGRWQTKIGDAAPWLGFNYYYDNITEHAKQAGHAVSSRIQTGQIKTYMMALIALFVVVFVLPYFLIGAGVNSLIPSNLNFATTPYEVLVYGAMIVAALAALKLPKYLPAAIALSALGYLVALTFIFLKAPDLALTQVLVETLSTIIFLLVFVKIPQRFKEVIPKDTMVRDVLISGTVAVIIAVILLNATNGIMSPFESLSHYFIENSIKLAGGHNIVNVVIVDFRGYDTLGEISVLSLAALGVYNLIKSRGEDRQ